MSNCPFCDTDASTSPARAPRQGGGQSKGILRRSWRGIRWMLPSAALMLMPKCPMCVVGYVAIVTGVGITVSAAWWIRVLMLGFFAAWLGYLAVRQILGIFPMRRP